jgi:hypothetical protein
MTTASLETYFDKWAKLEERRKAIRHDNALSQLGKDQANARLSIDVAGVRDAFLAACKREWESIKTAYEANQARRTRAADAELARWDYGALAFETDRIANILKRNLSQHELAELWRKDKPAGLLVRAWAAAIGEKSPAEFATGELRNEIHKELERVRSTPDLEAANTKGKAIAESLVDFADDLNKFATLLARVSDTSGAALELAKIRNHIKVDRQYVVEGQQAGFKIVVEIVTPAADALASMTISDSPLAGNLFDPVK